VAASTGADRVRSAPLDGLRGKLRYVKSMSDVDALITAAPSYSIALVMPQSLFFK
jgi:hypothetical protein